MEFLLIASAHFLALLSPGPDFFLILQTALRMELRFAFSLCAGIAAANGVYLIIAVLGLETIRDMGWLMSLLKYLGSGYLISIGYLLLQAPRRPLTDEPLSTFLNKPSMKQQFSIGFMSAIFNPKNAIFYLSLFTVMVAGDTSLMMRGLYGLWMTLVVLVWDMGVALFMGSDRAKLVMERWIFGVEKFSGVMLALFGILLGLD